MVMPMARPKISGSAPADRIQLEGALAMDPFVSSLLKEEGESCARYGELVLIPPPLGVRMPINEGVDERPCNEGTTLDVD